VHEGGLSPDGLAVSATTFVISGLRGAGATPWMAPELLDDENERPKVTKETDVYALGMLIIETYTGRPPFHGEVKKNSLPFKIVTNGLRPKRLGREAESLGFTAQLWLLAEYCWAQEPRRRPQMAAVRTLIESLY